jgi:2-polyprenyl-6-methoxyphenol hydroxylase-like FAD-dependent oxidoreductase
MLPFSAARTQPHAVVVGAGPVGCAAALALARAGKRVALLDSGAGANRFAGEWLHPTGAKLLAELGFDPLGATVPHAAGTGFAIFTGGTAEPLLLPYPDSGPAVGCEHHLLVSGIRAAVEREPLIEVFAGFRAAEVAHGFVRAAHPASGRNVAFAPKLVVGADGRQSLVRKALGFPSAPRPVSYMVGLLVDPAALPVNEYGHVFLDGPGPVLAYRIGPDRARVCIDVPTDRVAWVRNSAELVEAYRGAIPPALHEACAKALAGGPPEVAANQLLPRKHFGRGGIALVGDAVGHCHPLCAVGMTVGFQDAVALARAETVEAYSDERRSASRVPELVSTGLYDVFAGRDESAKELRAAVVRMWQKSPAARRDTMRLLAVRDTRRSALLTTFTRLMLEAGGGVVRGIARRPIRSTVAALAGFGGWAHWFARESLAR